MLLRVIAFQIFLFKSFHSSLCRLKFSLASLFFLNNIISAAVEIQAEISDMLNFAPSLCSSAIFFFGSDDEFSLACLVSLAHVYVIYEPFQSAETRRRWSRENVYTFFGVFLCFFLPCLSIITRNYRVEHHRSMRKRARDGSTRNAFVSDFNNIKWV